MITCIAYDIADKLGDIHIFRVFEDWILLDIESGSIHMIDETVKSILEAGTLDAELLYKKFTGAYAIEEINEAIQEITSLIEDGTLFAPKQPLTTCGNPGEVKAMCLNIAQACNMRCGYCFACDGGYGGEAALMNLDTACKAIDLLIKMSGSRKNIEVDFFGGEPLLNFETVKKTVAYGKAKAQEAGKNIAFTLTTNAVLLDDKAIEFLNDNNMSTVLSLDGRQSTHDRMRRHADGSASYMDIAPRIKKFVDTCPERPYYVRGTYTRHNLDFAADVEHIAQLGIPSISVEPVVGKPEDEWAIKENDIPTIKQEYKRLATTYLRHKREGHEFAFFHFNINLTKGPCTSKRASGCGSGVQYIAVAADGKLYPCHQFVGQDDFILGDVVQGLVNQEIPASFAACNIETKTECKKCWARYFCGGGCHANAWQDNADISKPYAIGCDIERIRVECAIAIKVEEANEA